MPMPSLQSIKLWSDFTQIVFVTSLILGIGEDQRVGGMPCHARTVLFLLQGGTQGYAVLASPPLFCTYCNNFIVHTGIYFSRGESTAQECQSIVGKVKVFSKNLRPVFKFID